MDFLPPLLVLVSIGLSCPLPDRLTPLRQRGCVCVCVSARRSWQAHRPVAPDGSRSKLGPQLAQAMRQAPGGERVDCPAVLGG